MPRQTRKRSVGRPSGRDDVRRSIVSAALNQLTRSGSPESVTVSAILDEAGCTAPSLYHYWPSRHHLLREASGLGWQQFRDSQSRAATATDDPVERVRQRGRGYLEFSLAHPALFRVLFLTPGSMDADAPPSQEGNALAELVADVAAAVASGALRPRDPLVTALALWSTVHGVAALWAVTPHLSHDLARAVAETAQDAVLSGLAGP